MAYASWSVVFGEQPSATKWNILGTNDAEFNSMIVKTAGGLTTVNLLRMQNDNANSINDSTASNVMVQGGWAQTVGDASADIFDSITFPTEFDTILYVMTSTGGRGTSGAAATIANVTLAYASGASSTASWDDVTVSGFNVSQNRSTGSYTSGEYYAFSWQAWGTKT